MYDTVTIRYEANLSLLILILYLLPVPVNLSLLRIYDGLVSLKFAGIQLAM